VGLLDREDGEAAFVAEVDRGQGAAYIGRLGTFVTGLALPTAAIELLGAGPVEVGAFAALQSSPFAMLGIPSGVLVDRLPRRPIMIACDLGRLAALASIPLVYLWYGLSVYHLSAVALLVGT